MAPYKLIISYDGTHYFGYQRQGNQKTVQLELERALQALGWQGQSILAAGRTDSGVHARAQVILADIEWKHSDESLGYALNAHLPADIAVREVHRAEADFHPRYSAKARTYHYRVYCQQNREPLKDRFAWQVWPAVSMAALNETASLILGEHDFSAFGQAPKAGGPTIRQVHQSEWHLVEGEMLEYRLTANSFLYHMVRRLTASQIAIAQQLVPFTQMEVWLQGANEVVQYLAPPNGLVLDSVRYD